MKTNNNSKKQPIVAITGGIGSGKTYIGKLLERQNIRIYDCDKAAKRLLEEDKDLQHDLTLLVSPRLYRNGKLDKLLLRDFLFQSEENRNKINDIIHPAVARDFEQSSHSWLETAILFDAQFYKRTHIDYVICVTAPLQIRLQRVMRRDNATPEIARQWIGQQMPQEEVMKLSDFVIVNDGTQDLHKQIKTILNKLNINKK